MNGAMNIKTMTSEEYANIPTTKAQRIAEAAKQRELEFLKKRAAVKSTEDTYAYDEESDSNSAFDDGENIDQADDYVAAEPVRATVPSNSNSITITLPNQRTEVSLAVYVEGSKQFKLTFTALNVSMNDDCVSILTDGNLHIAPPTLSDIELTLDSIKYNVQYLGGSHKFGAYNQITFIRIES